MTKKPKIKKDLQKAGNFPYMDEDINQTEFLDGHEIILNKNYKGTDSQSKYLEDIVSFEIIHRYRAIILNRFVYDIQSILNYFENQHYNRKTIDDITDLNQNKVRNIDILYLYVYFMIINSFEEMFQKNDKNNRIKVFSSQKICFKHYIKRGDILILNEGKRAIYVAEDYKPLFHYKKPQDEIYDEIYRNIIVPYIAEKVVSERKKPTYYDVLDETNSILASNTTFAELKSVCDEKLSEFVTYVKDIFKLKVKKYVDKFTEDIFNKNRYAFVYGTFNINDPKQKIVIPIKNISSYILQEEKDNDLNFKYYENIIHKQPSILYNNYINISIPDENNKKTYYKCGNIVNYYPAQKGIVFDETIKSNDIIIYKEGDYYVGVFASQVYEYDHMYKEVLGDFNDNNGYVKIATHKIRGYVLQSHGEESDRKRIIYEYWHEKTAHIFKTLKEKYPFLYNTKN